MLEEPRPVTRVTDPEASQCRPSQMSESQTRAQFARGAKNPVFNEKPAMAMFPVLDSLGELVENEKRKTPRS